MGGIFASRWAAVRITVMVLVLAVGGAAGCGDSGASPTVDVAVRDSAGIRIVESPSDLELPRIDLRARPPLLRIGALDGDEGEVLYRVTGAFPLSDRRLVIGNAGSHEIRFYDESGTLESSVGREGDGPGEFRRLTWIGPAGADSIAAFDGDGREVAVFDADGRLARTFRLTEFRDPGSEEDVAPRWPLMVGRLGGGNFVVGALPIVTTGPVFEGIPDDSIHYYFVVDGGASDRAPLPVPASENWVESSESAASVMPVPLGRRTDAAVGADILWVGMTDSNDIRGYGEDGALRLIIRRDLAAQPVTPADIERYKDERMALAADNPDLLNFLRESFERIPFASHHPLFSSIIATEQGGIWVEEYSADSDADASVWTVYAADGRPVGSARLPPGANILYVTGDSLVLRREDELSVEYVEIHGLDVVGAEAEA